MAARKPGVIALFDVDGTLTAPRKVYFFLTMYIDVILNARLFHGVDNSHSGLKLYRI